MLSNERYFDPQPEQKKIALELYQLIANLPLICPHGHVDPRLFADPDFKFGNPTELLITPDHYVFRMLYSRGVAFEDLGISRQDGGDIETNPQQIWQTFADHFYLFRGTPTGMWLVDELHNVFGITEKLSSESAQTIYEQINSQLRCEQFTPRRLYEQFNIEVLCTTDTATDRLEYHQAIQESDWSGRILPTFRPDTVVNIDTPNWQHHINLLSEVSGISVHNYQTYIQALENRRAFFKSMGATATDQSAVTPFTTELSPQDAETIFQRALKNKATPQDATRFTGHTLMEMARMSIEDGLVMQLHPGSYRNHNQSIFAQFGPDKGADIPQSTEYTRNLQPLLGKFGSHPNFSLILFTLDETTYSRELAPLAGHYPALKLGPPWWFYDSLNGMQHFFEQTVETAGIYNTVGFNDDTRAFASIPARHDLWRRATANWLAGLLVRHIVDSADAAQMAHDLAYNLAKQAYHLE